jgi:hypothetical protein
MKKIKYIYEVLRALAQLLGRIADRVCDRIGDFLEGHPRFCVTMAAACIIASWMI